MEQGTRNKETDAIRGAAGGFRGLVAWQKSHELATAVFRTLSRTSSHRWLAVQAMRAATSVPANIAEGYTRGSLRDYARFLDIARGSLAELEYYIFFMTEEGLLSASDAASLHQQQQEAGRVLHGLWKSLKRNGLDWDHSGLARDRATEEIDLDEDEA